MYNKLNSISILIIFYIYNQIGLSSDLSNETLNTPYNSNKYLTEVSSSSFSQESSNIILEPIDTFAKTHNGIIMQLSDIFNQLRKVYDLPIKQIKNAIIEIQKIHDEKFNNNDPIIDSIIEANKKYIDILTNLKDKIENNKSLNKVKQYMIENIDNIIIEINILIDTLEKAQNSLDEDSEL